MLKQILAVLALLAIATPAAAEQIVVNGTGRAEAIASRAIVTAFNANILAELSEDGLPNAPAEEDVAADPIADLIRRADPTATESPLTETNGGAYAPWLVMMQGGRSFPRFEISVDAIQRVDRNLAPFRRLLRVSYEAVAPDAAALHAQALSAAIADARVKAAVVAAASGLRLGEIERIEETVVGDNSTRVYLAMASSGGGSAPHLPLHASSTAMLNITFNASR